MIFLPLKHKKKGKKIPAFFLKKPLCSSWLSGKTVFV